MARDYTARDLSGYNIYHLHEKNQTIYYDSITKTGYIVTNKNASQFSTWQLRLPLCIILASVLILFKLNVWLAIGIGVLAYIISSILFRKLFLENQPIQTNFKKPESKGFFRNIASRFPLGILKIIATMFLIMAIVMIVNQIIYKYTDVAKTITYIFTGISLVASIIVWYIAYLKKKENL